jgi:UDPglucose--hexose-1-phosphate uridylyltransferase
MQVRLKEAERYYELNDHCMLCDILQDEMREKTRIFYENDGFVSYSPYAALSPYHFWIVPKRHSPSFLQISPAEVLSLADIMKASFVKLFIHQRNPDYNFVLQSLAYFERESHYYHWYISVIPQIKQKGGLEYAGGFFVNPVMPEFVADEFRKIDHAKAELLTGTGSL